MIARHDYRSGGRVTLEMTPSEFTETVEWLELLSPDDGCTHHWRDEHDRVMPNHEEE